VGECIEEYLRLTRSHLKWAGNEKLGTHHLDNYQLPTMSEYLAGRNSFLPFELQLTSADKIQEAGAFNLYMLMNGVREGKEIGYLSISFPLSFLQQFESGFFQHLLHDWCRRLTPYHGYAGLGFIQCAAYAPASFFEPNLYPLIKRFPGIEFDEPSSHSLYFTEGIKGVNWLTILSNEFITKIGGLDHMKAQLDDSFLFYDFEQGSMIQAGPHPQIGDSEQENIPKQYQELYRVVKPVQGDYKYILFKTPDDVDGTLAAQEWLHRFD